jgi:hypothetical protein
MSIFSKLYNSIKQAYLSVVEFLTDRTLERTKFFFKGGAANFHDYWFDKKAGPIVDDMAATIDTIFTKYQPEPKYRNYRSDAEYLRNSLKRHGTTPEDMETGSTHSNYVQRRRNEQSKHRAH